MEQAVVARIRGQAVLLAELRTQARRRATSPAHGTAANEEKRATATATGDGRVVLFVSKAYVQVCVCSFVSERASEGVSECSGVRQRR